MLIAPPPTTRGNSAGPAVKLSESCGQDLPFPPGPQPSCPAPWLQSYTSSAGMARIQNPFWEQSTASRRSASSEGQRAEADTPTRFSSPPDPSSRTGDPCPSCPNKNWGPRRTLCFLEEGSIGPSVPRPSDAFLSDAAWEGRGPPGGCTGAVLTESDLNPQETLHPEPSEGLGCWEVSSGRADWLGRVLGMGL